MSEIWKTRNKKKGDDMRITEFIPEMIQMFKDFPRYLVDNHKEDLIDFYLKERNWEVLFHKSFGRFVKGFHIPHLVSDMQTEYPFMKENEANPRLSILIHVDFLLQMLNDRRGWSCLVECKEEYMGCQKGHQWGLLSHANIKDLFKLGLAFEKPFMTPYGFIEPDGVNYGRVFLYGIVTEEDLQANDHELLKQWVKKIPTSTRLGKRPNRYYVGTGIDFNKSFAENVNIMTFLDPKFQNLHVIVENRIPSKKLFVYIAPFEIE